MDIGIIFITYCAVASLLLINVAYDGFKYPWSSVSDAFLKNVMLCILWPIALFFIIILFFFIGILELIVGRVGSVGPGSGG